MSDNAIIKQHSVVDKAFQVKNPEKIFTLTIDDHKLIEKRLELHEEFIMDYLIKKTNKVFEDLAEAFANRDADLDRRDAKIDKKFDIILNEINKVTKSITVLKKSVGNLNKKVSSLQKVQKTHDKKIHKMEIKLDQLLKEHKCNHPG